jgi:hypothetical protein
MTLNSKICPFCKKENLCEAHIVNNNCWCNTIKVPKDLRALIPQELQMKACICKKCILAFKENKNKFSKEVTDS